MNDVKLLDLPLRIQISGPLPYPDDDDTYDVWVAQLSEHLDREVKRMEHVLSLLYPQMKVTVE